jgi:transposase
MGRPHPVELRERVVAFVEEGNGHREAGRHFRVSPKFVNDMVRLKRGTGGLAPKPQGNPGRGKLVGVADWVRRRIAGKGDITLDELVVELSEHHGLTVHRSSVGRLLHRLGLSHKKSLAGRRAEAA